MAKPVSDQELSDLVERIWAAASEAQDVSVRLSRTSEPGVVGVMEKLFSLTASAREISDLGSKVLLRHRMDEGRRELAALQSSKEG